MPHHWLHKGSIVRRVLMSEAREIQTRARTGEPFLMIAYAMDRSRDTIVRYAGGIKPPRGRPRKHRRACRRHRCDGCLSRALVIAIAATMMLPGLADAAQPCNKGHPCPPPALTLAVSPGAPSLPDSAPLGSYVATLIASWSDGAPFTGTFQFAAPYYDDGGTFAISGNNIIISPAGLGIQGDGGSIQTVSVIAVQ